LFINFTFVLASVSVGTEVQQINKAMAKTEKRYGNEVKLALISQKDFGWRTPEP